MQLCLCFYASAKEILFCSAEEVLIETLNSFATSSVELCKFSSAEAYSCSNQAQRQRLATQGMLQRVSERSNIYKFANQNCSVIPLSLQIPLELRFIKEENKGLLLPGCQCLHHLFLVMGGHAMIHLLKAMIIEVLLQHCRERIPQGKRHKLIRLAFLCHIAAVTSPPFSILFCILAVKSLTYSS